jgi:hypothetical protein
LYGGISRLICEIGIVVLIVGSIVPGMYYAFYDAPVLQAFYTGRHGQASAPKACVADDQR